MSALTNSTNLTDRVIRLFIYSASSILMMTATAKLISSFGGQRVLQSYEPISGLPFRDVFKVAGSLEFAVGLICIFHRSILLNIGLIGALGSCFFVYRLALVWLGYHIPCSCLGNLTDALSISPNTADIIMKICLAYLLVGSYGSLVLLWHKNLKNAA